MAANRAADQWGSGTDLGSGLGEFSAHSLKIQQQYNRLLRLAAAGSARGCGFDGMVRVL
jgi:hypothetical protein